ncbi:OprD family outer membrane porin [Alteromonas sp. CYL-A6]|uniref:OprD family outer membrane porin n=1 Tax=Alteromonas nitratireducens TaxID=3390813 RepID=UPI0034BFB1F4
MKKALLTCLSLTALLCCYAVHAATETPAPVKRTLNNDMTLNWHSTPGEAKTLSEVFSKGMVYGRLRSNLFYWDQQNETASRQTNRANGLGGSIIFKTASLNGLSATVGFYTSQSAAFFREDRDDVLLVRAGKDTFDRNKVLSGGEFGITKVGEAYLQYQAGNTRIIAGRQLSESMLTGSNDAKMIPNVFDGVSLINTDLKDTTLRLSYFTRQSLRDHTRSHDVIAWDVLNQNDDSGANQSLTPELVGTDNTLIVAQLDNRSIEHLHLRLNYTGVPDVFYTLGAEVNYAFPLEDNWVVTPGLRYLAQFDDLNTTGDVAHLGGAGRADGFGYRDPDGLDSGLLNARIDVKKGNFQLRFGFSKVDDKADIIAPFRGFPTGGYSRAMAQVNWWANTRTYMVRADYKLTGFDPLHGMKVLARYAFQDFDDNKDYVPADSNVLHIDLVKQLTDSLHARLRFGFVSARDDIERVNLGGEKYDGSYNEYRFELNYLF